MDYYGGASYSGLYETISPTVLSMFCAPELQIAISGSQSEISIEDMRSHVRYAGGYVSFDVYMRRFWAVVEELSAEVRLTLIGCICNFIYIFTCKCFVKCV